jgi:integrase
MPRPRPPQLSHETTRHGKRVWYVRDGNGTQRRRVRIRAEYGTPEFTADYQAARAQQPQPAKRGTAAAGTLAWLIDRYRETTSWNDGLRPATRRQRENIFKQVIKTAGGDPYRAISQAGVMQGRDRRAKTPAQARHFLDAMRGLFEWAKAAQHVSVNPVDGVKPPRRAKSGGFPVWTEADAEAYDKRWPLGTKERVWRDVLMYTGLRRGDAVRVGRQHLRDGVITLRTEKSQGEMLVDIPVLPILAATLEAGPTGELSFICGEKGKPLTKESFGNVFREACRRAAVSKSAHGLRKIAATRAAEQGATVAQLNAIFGWKGYKMASLYTEAAERKRLAREAIGLLQKPERNIVALAERKA